jgi:hypothetical protein
MKTARIGPSQISLQMLIESALYFIFEMTLRVSNKTLAYGRLQGLDPLVPIEIERLLKLVEICGSQLFDTLSLF